MKKYRIAKDQSYKAGEEIKLQKITTIERINKVLFFFLTILTINFIFG